MTWGGRAASHIDWWMVVNVELLFKKFNCKWKIIHSSGYSVNGGTFLPGGGFRK